MKYLAFAMALVCGVPVMTVAAVMHERLRGLLVTLLFFSPALGVRASINFLSMENYRGPERGFEVTVTDLVALALVASMLVSHASKLKWWPYNTLWLLAGFALALVSSAQAPEPLFSAFTLWKFVRMYLIFWCVVNCLATGVDLRYVWLGIVMLGLYVGVLAVQQKYLYGLSRVHGPFDHSNTIPIYLHTVLPVMFLWPLCDKRFNKWEVSVSVVTGMLMLFAIQATQSRLGLVLAGVAATSSLALATWQHPSRQAFGWVAVFLLAGALGALKAADTIINRFLTAPEASEEARDEFNVAAADMAADHWFGVGLNSFSQVLTTTERYRKHIRVMANEEHAGVAHHIYWLTAAETGYPALWLYVWVILRFLWLAFRRSWWAVTGEQAFLRALFVGTCALHLTGLFEWAIRISPASYQFALSSGLIVGLAVLVKAGRVWTPEGEVEAEAEEPDGLECAPC